MGGPRKRVAGAIDGLIGGLSSVRDRIEPEDEEGSAPDDELTPAEETAPIPAGEADDDESGLTDGIRDRVASTVEYQKTVIRHPIAAQRAHLSALSEESPLSRSFWKEATISSPAVRERRVERIEAHLDEGRTVRDDARVVADAANWSRAWQYGKVGYVAGRKFSGRIPVADRYAPVAGALAGGAYGALGSRSDRSLAEADPEEVFDRVDALARLRDDPVSRAQVARDAVHEIDRRLGSETDPVPIEDVLPDDTLANLVTGSNEAVPDEIPHDPATRRLVTEDLLTRDPFDSPAGSAGRLPSAGGRTDPLSADLPLDPGESAEDDLADAEDDLTDAEDA